MVIKNLVLPNKLIFDSKHEIGPSTYSFNFTIPKPIKWHAGQHAILELELPDGKKGFRPFSIASAPGENLIAIGTKINDDNTDLFKQTLFRLKRGTPAWLRGPIGRAYIKHNSEQYGFLTTGIGITPFRAILKQLVLDGNLDTKITLFFVGNKDTHYFKDELNSLKNVLRNFSIEYIYKPERITGQVIEEKLGKDVAQTIFFISGSPALVRNYKRTLLGLGVPRVHIKSSTFVSYRQAIINQKEQIKSVSHKIKNVKN